MESDNVIIIVLLFFVAFLYLVGKRALLKLLALGVACVAVFGLMFDMAWSMDKQIPLQWLDTCAGLGRQAVGQLAESLGRFLH